MGNVMHGRMDWPLTGARAGWTGAMLTKDSIAIDLGPAQCRAINRLLGGVDDPVRPVMSIRRDEFTDPALDEALHAIEVEVKHGHGLAFLRGLPVAQYSLDQLRRIFWGIGTFFGRTVSQSEKGDHLGEVVAKPGGVRGYDSAAELHFHNDLAELLTLLCVQPAQSGGVNVFVSMMAARATVLREHPEYMPVFERGFRLERAPGSPQFRQRTHSEQPIPLFSEHEGVTSCWLTLPDRARRCARDLGLPLIPLEEDALAFLDSVIHADGFAFSATLERGEAVFINNYEVVHSRTAFVEFEEAERSRRLLRMWLQSDRPRPMSPAIHLYPNPSGMQGMDPSTA